MNHTLLFLPWSHSVECEWRERVTESHREWLSPTLSLVLSLSHSCTFILSFSLCVSPVGLSLFSPTVCHFLPTDCHSAFVWSHLPQTGGHFSFFIRRFTIIRYITCLAAVNKQATVTEFAEMLSYTFYFSLFQNRSSVVVSAWNFVIKNTIFCSLMNMSVHSWSCEAPCGACF